jgi:SAM-dependent methyltransferase
MNHQCIPLDRPLLKGFLDRVEIDASGLIRVVGWSKLAGEGLEATPSIRLGSVELPSLQTYRVSRPDVETAEKMTDRHAGVVCEYLIPPSLYGQTPRVLSLNVAGYVALQCETDVTFVEPDYRPAFECETVLHRSHIYGSGSPNAAVHPEVLALATKLPGPVLDFGCGSGALTSELEGRGIPCRGLELAGSRASLSVPASLQGLVTFYDGTFPSPIESRSARSVFCSEVLEHIPDYEAAIRDMARIATERVVITVPDVSAIPLGARHQLVPWHLLESTHVNFFNQTSLERALRPHFKEVTFGRICPCLLNDTDFHVSIVAYCRK